MYDAFISYSWKADGKLSPAIHGGLKSFAKPLFKYQALRVYVDKSDLTSSPHLWMSIRDALEESKYFILMASPDSAKSKWVQRELQYWMQHHDYRNLIIVLTEGDIVWDETLHGFDWTKTNAISSFLGNYYDHEPLFVDMREVKSKEDFELGNPKFKLKIGEIASTIRKMPLDHLVGSEMKNHKKLIRLRNTAATLLLMLLTSTIIFAEQMYESKEDAVHAQLIAEKKEKDNKEKARLLLTSYRKVQHALDSVNKLNSVLDTAELKIVDLSLKNYIQNFIPSKRLYYKMLTRFRSPDPQGDLDVDKLQISSSNATVQRKDGKYYIKPSQPNFLKLNFIYEKDSLVEVSKTYFVHHFPEMGVEIGVNRGRFIRRSTLTSNEGLKLFAKDGSSNAGFKISNFNIRVNVGATPRTMNSGSDKFTSEMKSVFKSLPVNSVIEIIGVRYTKPNGTSSVTNKTYKLWEPGAAVG